MAIDFEQPEGKRREQVAQAAVGHDARRGRDTGAGQQRRQPLHVDDILARRVLQTVAKSQATAPGMWPLAYAVAPHSAESPQTTSTQRIDGSPR
ncbi:MAG: hypothetical protein KIS91_09740 [Anaerolineae bacterium]|nr:hypothetical protein [Anaerolineae bacterium]